MYIEGYNWTNGPICNYAIANLTPEQRTRHNAEVVQIRHPTKLQKNKNPYIL